MPQGKVFIGAFELTQEETKRGNFEVAVQEILEGATGLFDDQLLSKEDLTSQNICSRVYLHLVPGGNKDFFESVKSAIKEAAENNSAIVDERTNTEDTFDANFLF